MRFSATTEAGRRKKKVTMCRNVCVDTANLGIAGWATSMSKVNGQLAHPSSGEGITILGRVGIREDWGCWSGGQVVFAAWARSGPGLGLGVWDG
jgi:hypothetical protein